MEVRIEAFALGFDRLEAHALESVVEPLIDQLDALGKLLVGGFGFAGALEIVNDGEQVADDVGGSKLEELRAFALGAAAGIFELGPGAAQAVVELGLFGG